MFIEDELLTIDETTQLITAMGKVFPDAKPDLNFTNNFELLCAVILSAQTTDIGVNKVTPALFDTYPTPQKMMQADIEDLQDILKTIGLYRNKSKFLLKMSRSLVEDFNGEVPDNRKDLMSLAGVGRKTANVVLSVGFHVPAIAVDTHVERISKRFQIVPQDATVRKVEDILMEKLPEDMWHIAHHILIYFGRYQCPARKHDHDECIRLVQEQL